MIFVTVGTHEQPFNRLIEEIDRLKGEGVEDLHSGSKGNMYVIINVVIPDKIDKKQKKLFEELNDTNLKTIGLLWYNKDADNQYIGFNDGIYTPQYDELEYLALARMDTRLLAQKGREGVPTDKESLNLAANIEEAVPLI